MSHTVDIILSSDKFYPGGMMTGNVTFGLHKEISSVDEVFVSLQGNANTHWSKRYKDSKGNHRTKHYRGSERYFKVKNPLLNENVNSLPQGQHKFPFSFLLPNGIPQSFSYAGYGVTASITYKFKAKIKRGFLHSNIQAARPIYILGNIPLSACPTDPMLASIARDTKYLCCLWCKEGPINADITLNKTGYLPGETVFVNIDIENLSKTDIGLTRVCLERRLHVKTNGGNSKTIADPLAQLRVPGCPKGETSSIVNQPLQIPTDVAPTHLPFCNIILPEYKIKAEVVIDGFHTNIHMSVPIFIASFRPPAVQPAVAMTYPQPVAPFVQPSNLQPTAPYPNQPTPSAPNFLPYAPQPAPLPQYSKPDDPSEPPPPPYCPPDSAVPSAPECEKKPFVH